MKLLSPLVFLGITLTASAADYQLVYVRSQVPAGRQAVLPSAGAEFASEESDLMLLHTDGTFETLYDPGVGKAIIDPCPSLDAKWVFFSMGDLPKGFQAEPDVPAWYKIRAANQAIDIYKINVETKELIRLTHQESTPFAGEPRTLSSSGTGEIFGVLNLGSCPIPGGKVIYTSDSDTPGVNQLWVMRDDGSHKEKVGYLNLSNCLNPVLLSNGRILWSTKEDQGFRSMLQWGLWSSLPDGRDWRPEFSAFVKAQLFKFHTEAVAPIPLQEGYARSLVSTAYYGSASSGFGTFYSAPLEPRSFTHAVPPPFGHNVSSFWPTGATWPTPWASAQDSPAQVALGKVSHPSIAEPGFILCSWTPGPAYEFAHKVPGTLPPSGVYLDSGIYLHPLTQTSGPSELIKVIDEPGWNEYFPKVLLPASELYKTEIPEHPFLPPATHPALKPGEPYGLLGSSGVYQRESKALVPEFNFILQGADAGEFENSEIHAIRFLTMEINPVVASTPLRTQLNHHETLRVLGEIPLRKPGIIDAAGNPDTSFLAKIPADVPFTFQLIDVDGQALTTSPTWHHLRAGEVRTDCRGCHAHTQPGIEFSVTEASKPGFAIADLTQAKPKVLEYSADIKPIFEKYDCNSCHDGTDAAAPQFDYENWFGATSIPPNTQSYRNLTARLFAAYQSRTSRLMSHLRGDIGFERMPKNGDALTPAELRTIATWIDTGAALGSLANNDRTKPTVSYAPGFVGAFDYNLSDVKVNGVSVGTTNGVYPVANGPLEVIATDAKGNQTKLIREATSERIPSAVYLGLDGDNVGPARQGTPDGQPDHHIKLKGLKPNYNRINVHFGATKWSNEAEIPIVLGRPSIPGSPLGVLDLWFAPRNGSETATKFTVFIRYADGTEDRIETTESQDSEELKQRIAALEAEVAKQLAKLEEFWTWLGSQPK